MTEKRKRAPVPAKGSPTWVRSWDSDVPASRSSAELETLLRRYGAHGYTVSNDYAGGTLVIAFTMPRSWQVPNADSIEIKMAVSYGETERRLQRMPEYVAKRRGKGSGADAWAREQSERVAWRQVVFLVEAGLNAAAAGIQTIEEAFFAHSVLPGTNQRVIDLVHEHRQRLLPGGENSR